MDHGPVNGPLKGYQGQVKRGVHSVERDFKLDKGRYVCTVDPRGHTFVLQSPEFKDSPLSNPAAGAWVSSSPSEPQFPAVGNGHHDLTVPELMNRA